MKRGPLPPLSARRLSFKLPSSEALEVRWIAEGDGWVVVSKPSGLLSVPGSLPGAEDSVESRVRARYPQATGGVVVHRLDLPTSGLMVFALRPETLASLNEQFATRQTGKRYVAVLEREPLLERVRGSERGKGSERVERVSSGDIKLPLRLDPFQRPLQIHDPIHGRACHTRWERVGEHPRGVIVHMTPVTGRTHQLRVHAAHPLGLNAPIVGDPHYSRDATADGSSPGGVRLHLHAAHLAFDDPTSGERLSFDDAAPF